MADLRIVAYDLHEKDETDYTFLITAIKACALDSFEIQRSVWIIASNDNCTNIRDTLVAFVENDDKLFVSPLPTGSAWSHIEGLKQFIDDSRKL